VVDMKVDQIWQALLQLSPHWGLVEMVQQDAKTRSDVKDHRKRVLTRICNLVMKVIEAYKVEDARNQAGLSWSDHRNPVERMAILNLIDVRQKRIVRVVLDDQTPRPEKSAAVPNS
jgi:beta-xylosidase